MTQSENFVIENGVLKKYRENGETVVQIPEGVTRIDRNAFLGCSSLKEINIPKGVIKIMSSAFEFCSNLEEIKIPEGITLIGNHAFEDCSSLKKIKIPESVTKIGDFAFSGCSNLTEINLPDDTKKIASSAFKNCKKLADDNGFFILDSRLFSCISPEKNITIPDGIREICPYAFKNLSSLETVQLPESITKIGNCAFEGCSNLKKINLPDYVHVSDFPFYGCCSLEQVLTSEKLKKELYSNFDIKTLFGGEKFTPSLIKEIFSSLEKPVKNKKALLAEMIKRDDAGALQVLLDMKYVANTKIRDELIELASSSGKTESLTVLLNYKERTGNRVKEEKLREKKLNRELDMPAEKHHRNEMRKIWKFSYVSVETKSEYRISGYKGNDTVIEVPAAIGGVPVTVINRKAFFEYSGLEEIKIPGSVTAIEWCAFYCCSSLKKIELPENVTYIGAYAFAGCDNLTIYAPAGSYAEQYAKERNIPFIAE